MATKAKKVTDISLQKSRRVIQLDQSQFALYKTGQIDIYSPDGFLLESVGHLPEQERRTSISDQLCLVESLVVNSNGFLEISERGIVGLAELLHKSHKIIG